MPLSKLFVVKIDMLACHFEYTSASDCKSLWIGKRGEDRIQNPVSNHHLLLKVSWLHIIHVHGIKFDLTHRFSTGELWKLWKVEDYLTLNRLTVKRSSFTCQTLHNTPILLFSTFAGLWLFAKHRKLGDMQLLDLRADYLDPFTVQIFGNLKPYTIVFEKKNSTNVQRLNHHHCEHWVSQCPAQHK